MSVLAKPEPKINRTPVDSSHIASDGYDAATQTLHVEFKSRTPGKDNPVFAYDNVPAETAAKYMGADSRGKAFHQLIRPTYTGRLINPQPVPDGDVKWKDLQSDQAGRTPEGAGPNDSAGSAKGAIARVLARMEKPKA